MKDTAETIAPRIQPLPTWHQRTWRYVRVMFPPAVNVPFTFLGFYVFYLLLEAHAGLTRGGFGHPTGLPFGLSSLIGAITLVGFSLLMRIFDEFKDFHLDQRLFPDRPLPSGQVLPRDLKILGWGLAIGMTALNALLGWAFLGFALLMAFGLLTYKWFFLEDLHRKNLLFTLSTHQPAVLFAHLYSFGVFLETNGLRPTPPGLAVWAYVVMLWMPLLAWEVSRKIRVPEAENDYVTYSMILGPRRAALLPFLALSLSTAIGEYTCMSLRLPVWTMAALAGNYAIVVVAYTRWFWRPTPAASRLRPIAEGFGLALYLLLVIALLVTFGVRTLTP